MPLPRKTAVVLAIQTLGFAVLAYSFTRVPARPGVIVRPPLVAQSELAIVPGTVRISAGQLIASGGDTSGLACYACHHQDSPPEVRPGPDNRIVLPKEHSDLIISMRNCAECHPANDPVALNYDANGVVQFPKGHEGLVAMAHGHTFRNNSCYNCHDRDQLDQLHTPDGAKLAFSQATQLCGSCHGPTYRDWKAGAHGRTGGYWDRSAGPIKREECTSCHDPHAPAFTGLIPMPGPHLLHPAPVTAAPKAAADTHAH
jgi:predicted CXXCH cytochrome family protein